MSVGWQVPQESRSAGRGKRTTLLAIVIVVLVAAGAFVALVSGDGDAATGDALAGGLDAPVAPDDGTSTATESTEADSDSEQPLALATPDDPDEEFDPTPTEADDAGEVDDDAASAAPFVVDPYDATSIAAAISQKVFPDGEAQNVVLARESPSGDALAAGALIGLFDTTLLLTDSERLSPITAAELDRLGTPRIHILGGENAISSDIEAELADNGHDVHRHAGHLQEHTAVDIAAAHFNEARTAVLIRTPEREAGVVEAVASALAPTALAASQDLPVLLTGGSELSPGTDAYLQGAVIDRVIVVGGEDEISSSVTSRLRALGIDWTRWGGDDRFSTAVEVARGRGFQTVADADVVILVEGGHDAVWPAGFLATVIASRSNGPVLLTDGTNLPSATAEYLEGAEGDVLVVCTPGVTDSACSMAREQAAG